MAKAFEYAQTGMGMTQFNNGDIALVGGNRTGKQGTPGTFRLHYAIFDVVAYASGRPGGKEKVGDVEINVRPAEPGEVPDIEGLVNIAVLPRLRDRDIGTRTIRALQASSAMGLKIYDIRSSAMGFWKKMGATVYAARGGRRNGDLAVPEPEEAMRGPGI